MALPVEPRDPSARTYPVSDYTDVAFEVSRSELDQFRIDFASEDQNGIRMMWQDAGPSPTLLKVFRFNNGEPVFIGSMPLPASDYYSFQIEGQWMQFTHMSGTFVDPPKEPPRYDVRFPVYVPRY